MAFVLLAAFALSSFESATTSTASAALQKKSRNNSAQKRNKKKSKRRAQQQRNKRKAPPKLPSRRITVAKVDPNTRDEARASAEEIDRLVGANYEKHNVKPNPRTTDEQFVRRIFLDITGTIPTHRQVDAFLRLRDPDRRSRLIDLLLNSWGYASHHYNYWGDVLRLKDRLQRRLPATAYNEWIKVALEENKPYDRMVYEMLTANGKIFDEPAAGYFLRDAGMRLDNMNNTVRVFLGTQIGCAQCHDHPFDRWTQKEFYEMAAFVGSTQTRLSPRSFGGRKRFADLRTELQEMSADYRMEQQVRGLMRSNLFVVHDRPRTSLRFPKDYAYDNAQPRAIVKPRTLFGEQVVAGTDETSREAFARWLTAPDNPRFALTIANRLWAKCLGVGVLEPLDEIRDDSAPENEPLLEFLTAEMVRVGFDMKEYLRIIYNTETYQRQATAEEVVPGEEYHFPGPILRRMTAEQVWDSFITLAIPDADDFQRIPASVENKVLNIDVVTAEAEEIVDKIRQRNTKLSGRSRYQYEKEYRHGGLLLARASELPTPTKPSHFLRQFGQSDRELISAASTGGSVPQVLQMFNGPITHMLLHKKSQMYKNVVKQREQDDQIDVIFKSILARAPSRTEAKVAAEEINSSGPAGYGNVIWALVNTREFLFIQ